MCDDCNDRAETPGDSNQQVEPILRLNAEQLEGMTWDFYLESHKAASEEMIRRKVAHYQSVLGPMFEQAQKRPWWRKWRVSGKTITSLILLFVVAGLIAWDFFAVWKWGFDATISLVVFTAAKEWPLLPFLTGLICGHFFFPVQGVKNNE